MPETTDPNDDGTSRPSGRQTIRQLARQQARAAGARRREERAQQEKRLRAHAETVLTALGERDASIARSEQQAGEALWAMTRDEGLALGEAVEWCGAALSRREATRLRRLAEQHRPAAGEADGQADGQVSESRSTEHGGGAARDWGAASHDPAPSV